MAAAEGPDISKESKAPKAAKIAVNERLERKRVDFEHDCESESCLCTLDFEKKYRRLSTEYAEVGHYLDTLQQELALTVVRLLLDCLEKRLSAHLKHLYTSDWHLTIIMITREFGEAISKSEQFFKLLRDLATERAETKDWPTMLESLETQQAKRQAHRRARVAKSRGWAPTDIRDLLNQPLDTHGDDGRDKDTTDTHKSNEIDVDDIRDSPHDASNNMNNHEEDDDDDDDDTPPESPNVQVGVHVTTRKPKKVEDEGERKRKRSVQDEQGAVLHLSKRRPVRLSTVQEEEEGQDDQEEESQKEQEQLDTQAESNVDMDVEHDFARDSVMYSGSVEASDIDESNESVEGEDNDDELDEQDAKKEESPQQYLVSLDIGMSDKET
ncbi:hypothetical protein KCU67_g2793, partial [Aureobasidium melanogenum]